jgi:hypothetical protein
MCWMFELFAQLVFFSLEQPWGKGAPRDTFSCYRAIVNEDAKGCQQRGNETISWSDLPVSFLSSGWVLSQSDDTPASSKLRLSDFNLSGLLD